MMYRVLDFLGALVWALVMTVIGFAVAAFVIYGGACFLDHVSEPEVRYYDEGFIPDGM
ncbi:MAG: hypothetical protein ACI4OZ_10115 [Akkermansia sp.]